MNAGLVDILSAAIKLSVREAVVRNAELPMGGYDEKREQIDVNCKTDVGQAAVEMLASTMLGDSRENEHANAIERAVYNLCDLHSFQPGRGLNYSQLMPSFQIMICDYTILLGHKSFVNRYAFMNTVEGDTLSKSANIVFIELTKLKVRQRPEAVRTYQRDYKIEGGNRNGEHSFTKHKSGRAAARRLSVAAYSVA
jgi:hypothetical protein